MRNLGQCLPTFNIIIYAGPLSQTSFFAALSSSMKKQKKSLKTLFLNPTKLFHKTTFVMPYLFTHTFFFLNFLSQNYVLHNFFKFPKKTSFTKKFLSTKNFIFIKIILSQELFSPTNSNSNGD